MPSRTKSDINEQEIELAHRVERIIKYEFKDINLLLSALLHAGRKNQKIDFYNRNAKYSMERLEFLGDRILGMNAAEYVFNKYPDIEEGPINNIYTSLVQASTLQNIISQLGIDKIFYEFNANDDEYSEKVISDLYEAIMGAVYIDGGMKASNQLFHLTHKDITVTGRSDAKGALQEWAQKHKLSIAYNLLKADGPVHMPMFYVSLSVAGYSSIESHSTTKKKAERLAAEKFMDLHKIF